MVGNLHEKGKVVLVSCYELGHQPIAVAWAAAFLQDAGFNPVCVDTSVEGVDESRLLEARFVGISVPMHTALRLGFIVARRIRALNPSCYICFFGVYAALNSEHLLASVADAIIGGESEEALVRLLRNLSGDALEDWSGISRAGSISAPELRKLNFPVPARTTLPALERYVRLQRDTMQVLVAHVEASRGCKHVCGHCPLTPVYGGRFFIVPKDVVIEDVRRQVAAGARHVTFGDPDFLNGPAHSLRIARKIHQEFPFLTFDFTAKVEHLVRHKDMLGELAALGCLFVVSAVESLSDEVLRHLNKGHTRADFFAALRAVQNAGIVMRPSFVSFTPWTTLRDYIDVLDTIEDEDLIDCVDPVQYAVRLLIPPGSALLRSEAIQPMLGILRPESFTYEWKHPDPRMDRLCIDTSILAQQGVMRGEQSREIFGKIRHAAYQLSEKNTVAISPPAKSKRQRLGLTEPWFC